MNECCRQSLRDAAAECDRRWSELGSMPKWDTYTNGVRDGWDYAEQMLLKRADDEEAS